MNESEPTPSAPLVPELPTNEADVLCRYLADKVEIHQGKRPSITKAWQRDMDLLLRRGPLHQDAPEVLSPERVRKAIDTVFNVLAEHEGKDGFCWADQIRSPGALRDHWLQLAQACRRKLRVAQRDPLRRDPASVARALFDNDPLRRGTPLLKGSP